MTSLMPEETLHIYLTASSKAISLVLIVDRDKKQLRIHFVSRELQGPELNYQILEKLVLTLIYASKRLRRYFQPHKIEVLTNYPTKQFLLRLEKSGRLEKWESN